MVIGSHLLRGGGGEPGYYYYIVRIALRSRYED